MTQNHSLGELERLIVLAVLRCGDDAYGYTIQQELHARIGRWVTLGAIYTTLERLEDKGVVSSRFAASTKGRGGRPRRLFTVRASGVRALHVAQREWKELASGLEAILGSV